MVLTKVREDLRELYSTDRDIKINMIKIMAIHFAITYEALNIAYYLDGKGVIGILAMSITLMMCCIVMAIKRETIKDRSIVMKMAIGLPAFTILGYTANILYLPGIVTMLQSAIQVAAILECLTKPILSAILMLLWQIIGMSYVAIGIGASESEYMITGADTISIILIVSALIIKTIKINKINKQNNRPKSGIKEKIASTILYEKDINNTKLSVPVRIIIVSSMITVTSIITNGMTGAYAMMGFKNLHPIASLYGGFVITLPLFILIAILMSNQIILDVFILNFILKIFTLVILVMADGGNYIYMQISVIGDILIISALIMTLRQIEGRGK